MTDKPINFQKLGTKIKALQDQGVPEAEINEWLAPAGVDLATVNASGFGPQPTSAAPAPAPGALESFGQGVGQGTSMGFGDELGAAVAATIGRPTSNGLEAMPGAGWTDRYGAARDEIRGKLDTLKETNPKSYLGGEVAGAVGSALSTPALSGANWVASAPTRLAMANRSGLVAAGAGALNTFGRAEGEPIEQAKEAALGGAVSYPLGFVAPTVAGKATEWGGKAVDAVKGVFSPKAAAPAASEIAREAGSAAYKAVDDAGVVLKPEAMQRLIQKSEADLAEWGVDEVLQPGATRALQKLQQSGAENSTFKNLEILRRTAGRVNNPQNPSDGEAAGKIISQIDDFIETLGPDDVVQGSVDDAVSAIKTARANWSAFRKAQLLEEAVTKAEDRASTGGTGGNLVNSVRQNLRQILDNPKKSRGFTAEELAEIRKVARGGPIENLARWASSFAPSRGGVNAWAALAASSIPGGQAIPALGEVAHSFAKKSVLNEARQLPQMILQGSPAATAPQVSPYAELAKALMSRTPVPAGLGGSALVDALASKGGTP